jgi:hypothetical protein
MMYPRLSGFVGHAGDSVWMDPNGFPDDHPVVLAHPDLFTEVPPPGIEAPKRRGGRPLGSKNKPKLATVEDAPGVVHRGG